MTLWCREKKKKSFSGCLFNMYGVEVVKVTSQNKESPLMSS